jgi:hypothetical protein
MPSKKYEEMEERLEKECGKLREEQFIYFMWQRHKQYATKKEKEEHQKKQNEARADKMQDPKMSAQCANHGAYADYLRKRGFWRTVASSLLSFEISRPQSIEEGWKAANVVILIKKGINKEDLDSDSLIKKDKP